MEEEGVNHMRKILMMLVSILFVLILVACGGNKVDEATAEKYLAKAEEVILLLNDEDYEAVYEKFNAQMQAGLPVSKMEELRPIIEEAGSFEEISKASVEEKDGMHITVSQAKYSDQKRIYTISFDQNDNIAGLFIK